MKYCRNCGQKLEDDDNFCPKCGTKCDVIDGEVIDAEVVYEKPTNKNPASAEIPDNSSLATTSMVLGIIALVLSTPIFFGGGYLGIVGLVLAIMAVVMGADKRVRGNKKATAGMTMGIIALALSVIEIIIYILVLSRVLFFY